MKSVAQPEVGARGLRDTRRNDSRRQPGFATKRGPRASHQHAQNGALKNKGLWCTCGENCHCENGRVLPSDRRANGRRCPRLGSCSESNKSFGGRRDGVMTDITNITAPQASQAEKCKAFKPAQQSFQPPIKGATQELQVVAPAAPAVDMTLLEKDAKAQLNDVQNVEEYASDIKDHLFSAETMFPPEADYMDTQNDITAKMRMILVDWLIEVNMKYHLSQETLQLTVNLLDRYLSRKQVTRKRLQLVGVVALFIASKFEEIDPPELHDWVYITDNAYTKEDVLTMEINMLLTLGFQIAVPTAAHFFEPLVVANGCDAVHREATRYLLELGLLDIRMLQYKPSHMVAAALMLSNELFGRSPRWPDTMALQSRHSEQSLCECAEELRQLWKADHAGAGGQAQSVHKKFSMPRYHSVATMKFF